MKVGAENKKKAVGAVLLLAFSVFLLIRELSTSSPSPVVPTATTGAAKAAPRPRPRSDAHHYVAFVLAPTLDPRLRLDLLKDSEHLGYEGSGRNIFQEHLQDIPIPVAPGLTTDKKPVVKPKWTPSPPPSPPPIDLKFFGWASQPGEPRAIFLTRGADVFVAHEGDIIARRYKVVRITPTSVEIEDVLSNNKQNIPLSQG
jgi:hypothetical protein